jgi:hypothetical protein
VRLFYVAIQLCATVIYWYPFATQNVKGNRWPVIRKTFSLNCRYRVFCGTGHWQEVEV